MPTNGRKQRLSVQTKVLIPVIAFLVLVPAIMVGIVNNQIRRQVLEEARRALSTADGVFRQAIESRSSDLLTHARNALSESRYKAIAVVAKEPSAAADETIRNFLGERLEDYGDDCQVMLFTYGQRVSPVSVRRGASVEMEDFAKETQPISARALKGESSKGCVSLDGAAFYVASVPVTTDTSQLVGALTVGVRITEAAVQELGKLTHTEILLVSNNQPIASTLPLQDPALVQQIMGQDVARSGTLGGIVHSQSVVINADHYLALSGVYTGALGPQSGFRYALLSSFEPSLRALEDTQRTLVTVSIAGILLSATVVWFFVQRFTQPLRELRDTAEAVGRGDFSRRIARFSNDECGDLAEAFNHMTTNLQSSRAELEKTVESLKTTQGQLIQSEKLSAVGQFVAGVAHELNNPLTAVIGFSDLLVQTDADEKIRPHLELIAKSAHRCHKIVQNLLSFARQHAPERKLTQLNGTIEEVLEIMAYDLRTSNIDVVKDFQGDLPPIMADPHQLQQVFVNIVGNARQAIQAFRPDGQITVRTRSAGDLVRVEFTDNGPGISPENLSRIFDPFFTTKPVGKGTGLGLSLSYGLIQEHAGRIRVESELGRGATFIIELPVAVEPARARRETDRPQPRPRMPAGSSGKTVLIIDDEEWILTLARELLGACGHTVETASGGEAAFAAMRGRDFDVIVCDWKMPGMSGIQLYQHLLDTHPNLANRIVFMSGDVINESFQEFLKRHGKTCLAKPFPIEELQDAVAKILSEA